jgi:hypothetical protein
VNLLVGFRASHQIQAAMPGDPTYSALPLSSAVVLIPDLPDFLVSYRRGRSQTLAVAMSCEWNPEGQTHAPFLTSVPTLSYTHNIHYILYIVKCFIYLLANKIWAISPYQCCTYPKSAFFGRYNS